MTHPPIMSRSGNPVVPACAGENGRQSVGMVDPVLSPSISGRYCRRAQLHVAVRAAAGASHIHYLAVASRALADDDRRLGQAQHGLAELLFVAGFSTGSARGQARGHRRGAGHSHALSVIAGIAIS